MSNNIDLLNIDNIKETKILPKYLQLLFFVEMWERFSYYGMRSLLVLFMTSHFGFSDAKAYATYSLFAAICYAGPVLGGFLADQLMGFRNMVLIGGIIITIGHICMTLVGSEPHFIYLGLSLLALGTGLFKGNITNLLSCCYKENSPDRERGFTLFYVGVNLGSFLATIFCGYVASTIGWDYGFGLAGLGMLIGLIVFVKFQHLLGNNGVSPHPHLMKKRFFFRLNIFTITIASTIFLAFLVSEMLISAEFFANMLSIVGLGVFGIFGYIIFKSSTTQRQNLIALSMMICLLMCFFALEMQLGSLINLFTKRNVVKEVFGIMIPASISQAINPLSIIILGSLLSAYMKFNKKHATLMLILGLFTSVVCFFILYIGCVNADSNGKVGYLYLVIAISFMSLGELCIAPLVQSQTTLLAPKHLRGFIMGILMMSLAFSNLLGSVIAKFMSVPSIGGEVDFMESLSIYKEGFLYIALFNLGIVVMFTIFCSIFLHKVLTAPSYMDA